MNRWVVALAPLLLAACSADAVDMPTVEASVRDGLIEQTGDQGVTVDCPSEREWETGASFGCIARDSNGQTVRVTVYMESDAGDFTWATD